MLQRIDSWCPELSRNAMDYFGDTSWFDDMWFAIYMNRSLYILLHFVVAVSQSNVGMYRRIRGVRKRNSLPSPKKMTLRGNITKWEYYAVEDNDFDAANDFIYRFYLATVLSIPIIVKKKKKKKKCVYIFEFIHQRLVIFKHFSQHFICNNANGIHHFSELLKMTMIFPIVLSSPLSPPPPYCIFMRSPKY